jgi:protein-tyrosine-phosphatase
MLPRTLLLCTANQCRSPMAEGLLRHLLTERGSTPRSIRPGCTEGGVPATGGGGRRLAGRGIDLGAHRSRNR